MEIEFFDMNNITRLLCGILRRMHLRHPMSSAEDLCYFLDDEDGCLLDCCVV